MLMIAAGVGIRTVDVAGTGRVGRNGAGSGACAGSVAGVGTGNGTGAGNRAGAGVGIMKGCAGGGTIW